MLMGAHNGTVDHRIFVIGIRYQIVKHLLPYATLGPAAKARMHRLSIAKPLRQIAPGDAGTIAIQYRLHKQPIIGGCDTHRGGTSRQQILDPISLVLS
jgi:hypothetical protein